MSSSRATPARWARYAGTIALAAVLSAGCGGGGGGGHEKYPPAAPLLTQAATALRSVTSLSFSLRTDGTAKVKVKSADAKLLRNGNAQGSAHVVELGMPIQLDFVVIGKTVYLKGLTGGWQREPLASVAGIYDPSAVLDPGRGLAQVLRTARGAATTGRENVAGQSCYRIHATLDHTAVSRLVPGISADPPADMWISTSAHRVLKTVLRVPQSDGGKPGTATVTFADFDKPFTISAPAK